MRVVHLSRGSGNGVDSACLMTASNMLIGRGEDGDDNHCVCKLLRTFIVETNDNMPLDLLRELYTPLIWEILGTRTDDQDVLVARAFSFADWAVREILPLTMESAGLVVDADRLRALDRIVDSESAVAASSSSSSARATARAAASAARADVRADAAGYDAQFAARTAFFAARAAAYIADAANADVATAAEFATAAADGAAESAACAAATGADIDDSIWHKCPEIIRRVAEIGDKRPVEIVLSNDQLCEMLNE